MIQLAQDCILASLFSSVAYPPTDDALPGTPAGSIFNGQSRVAPEHILMLPFTKNAAAEMRSRVTEAIEHELASGDPDNQALVRQTAQILEQGRHSPRTCSPHRK